MLSKLLWLLAVGATLAAVQALPAGAADEAKKSEQPTRPKVKRTQELLMFGNQQNRQATENKAAKDFSPLMAEKRTLSNSGLDDAGSTLAEAEQQQQQQQPVDHPKALPSTYVMDQPSLPLREKSYESMYQEPRYKRELDANLEELLTFLTLVDSERQRNRGYGNLRSYANDEYDSADDETNMIGLEDEDPRSSSWLSAYPQQHNFVPNEQLLGADMAVIGRPRPGSYYDQYGSRGTADQQYDSAVQYGTPQYGVPYVQHAYYPPEKRFLLNRKPSQNYDSFGERSNYMLNTRGYPNYRHRLMY